jgi:hypothetical protein
MKKEDILTIVAGAILAYVAWKTLKPAAAKIAGPSFAPANTTSYAKKINNNADPGEPGWAWTYYDGGVAIAPNGDYYLNGNLQWRAP